VVFTGDPYICVVLKGQITFAKRALRAEVSSGEVIIWFSCC